MRRAGSRASGPSTWPRTPQLTAAVHEIAEAHGATPAQVALAWLLGRRAWVVPIPGTKRPKYIEDNVGAPDVTLSAGDEERLETLAASVEGARYESEARTPTWVSPPLAS